LRSLATLLPPLKALGIDAAAAKHLNEPVSHLPLPVEVLIGVHALHTEHLLCECVSIPELRCAYSSLVRRRQAKAQINADVVEEEVESLLHRGGWTALFHLTSNEQVSDGGGPIAPDSAK